MKNEVLTTSNDSFSVSIPDSVYWLGSKVPGSIKIEHSASSRYGSFEVVFKGFTSFIPKFDPGLGPSVGFFQDFQPLKHIFIESEKIKLHVSEDKPSDTFAFELAIPEKLTCSCWEPSDSTDNQELALPSSSLDSVSSYSDAAQTQVIYELEIVGIKHNLLKSHETLAVPVTFSFNRAQELSQISRTRSSQIQRNFKGPEDKEIGVNVTLSTLSLHCSKLDVNLVFSAVNPEHTDYVNGMELNIAGSILRRSLCKHPRFHLESKSDWKLQFEEKVAVVDLEKVKGNVEGLAYKGEVSLKGMETIKGCQAAVEYVLAVTIDSPTLIGGAADDNLHLQDLQTMGTNTMYLLQIGNTPHISLEIFCVQDDQAKAEISYEENK